MVKFNLVVLGYELFTDISGMPAKYRHLRTRLRIEQSRLLIWAEKVGLVEDLLEEPSRMISMNKNLILDVLLEVQAAFKAAVKVTTVYDEMVPRKGPPPASANGTGSSLTQISILRRTLEHLEKPSKVIARLEWAMIKQEKFEQLIVTLIGYNDRIESFLDRSALDEIRVNQERSNLLLLQVTDQVVQLQALIDAMRIDSRDGGRDPAEATLNFSRTSTLAEHQDNPDSSSSTSFADLVKFKLRRKVGDGNSEDLQMLLNSKHLFPQGVPENEQRSTTKLYGKSLWVEWGEPVPEIPTIPNLAQIFEQRVASLASMLGSEKPSSFRGPHCLGYLRQEDGFSDGSGGLRYGLVYDASFCLTETEKGEGQSAQIRSLRDVLRSNRKPSLTIRSSLSCKLAESLMYLHAVNWLHKGIRSDSIMFCSSAAAPWSDSNLDSPILSGFEFSRPDTQQEVTIKMATTRAEHDLYRHPDLLYHPELRFQKSHDIYSLGLVLLEIAFWQPVEQLAHIDLNLDLDQKSQKGGSRARSSLIQPMREHLITRSFRGYPSLKEALAGEMGDAYAEAVWRCLRGGLDLGIVPKADEADPQTGAKIQQAFHDEVLKRLQHSS